VVFVRALFEQFRRLANVYFLFITILMIIGTYTTFFDSPLTPYSTLIPLIIVLTITMGKEGFEDMKRHSADRATNLRKAEVLSLKEPGVLEPIAWKDVRVGR
jgi:magnesium-transporting ATPase (P-type)